MIQNIKMPIKKNILNEARSVSPSQATTLPERAVLSGGVPVISQGHVLVSNKEG